MAPYGSLFVWPIKIKTQMRKNPQNVPKKIKPKIQDFGKCSRRNKGQCLKMTSYREYLILPTYSSLQSVAYTQVAYRRLPIDSSLLLSLEIFWPIPSMPEARL